VLRKRTEPRPEWPAASFFGLVKRGSARVLRTLQRPRRQWRAVHLAEREVFFAQAYPGRRHAVVAIRGVSFLAPFAGLHAALWRLGGVTQ
jgi:hypothetical protein